MSKVEIEFTALEELIRDSEKIRALNSLLVQESAERKTCHWTCLAQ